MKIKNFIFDLGNVILNIDIKLCEIAFSQYGLKNFSVLYSLAAQTEIFDRLETGMISAEEFYNEFREITKTDLSDKIIKDCWNTLIVDFPPERIELLQKLKNKFRTFVLSNTNAIHYDYYTGMLQTQFRIDGLEALTEKAYFSHKVGMKKPYPDIYKFVIDDAGINPAETLFIDDNYENIYAAEMLGIETIWLKDNNLTELEIWENYLK
ncbi:MAG: HAD family phosphatase [Bacteroidales bacterium]|jgi:putative hydrolase of the HAD superfamily|nr:HAD family phosphatase [Bacteroidales bacterium]